MTVITATLASLRTEALNHGFDPIQYSARCSQYLNDAQNLIARRVDYYVDEAVQTYATVSGQAAYPWPTNVGRLRSLFDMNRNIEMQSASIRDIDRSGIATGAPYWYALTGNNFQLYPTPDNIYNLELRYWSIPPAMVNDTDTPSVPSDWAEMLWFYAVAQLFEADDDAQMGTYWMTKFNNQLAMFSADQKFPSTDSPTQARGMWDQDRSLGVGAGWGFFGGL